jgi:Uma2 family endonuclease
MATSTRRVVHKTVDELLRSLGGVSPDRVRLDPVPGTATEKDVLRLYENDKRLFELVDGTLVEKVMGAKESFIAVQIILLLAEWNTRQGDAGMILAEAGTIKLLKNLVRIPDVSFTYWDHLPNRKVPNEAVPDLAPDLAVEVLSEKNTHAEMARKLKEYFLSGVRLVWFVDPRTRTAKSYTSPDDVNQIAATDALEGGEVLPGLRIPLERLFGQLDDSPEPAKTPRKRPSE